MRAPLKQSTILVTGGAGFIGSHLIDRLIKEGVQKIITVDNLFLGNKENIRDALTNGLTLYIDDAELEGSLEYIFTKYNIDIVFNCATKALNYSFLNPSNAYMTNVTVLKNLLELQRKQYFKTLCHFSSSEVYGTAIYEPMDENHPIHPTTTYAAGKASADILLQSYVQMFDLDAFIVRPFNNYGPRQNCNGAFAGVIPRTIYKILNGEAPEIHGSGKQKRDFIYVHDTIEAVLRVYDKLVAGDIVNISSEGQVSINEVVDKIVNILNYTGVIIRKEERKADVKSHYSSNKKLKSLIGEFEMTDFDKGLTDTISWYQKALTNGAKM